MLDLEKVKSDLAGRQRQVLNEPSLKPAAVLMPLLVRDRREHLILTRRTETVRHHKGQIAFPGGHQDPGEDLLATALRETYEEIGVSPKDVQVIGAIDDIATITNFRVTPFLGTIPYPYDFTLEKREIAELLLVPVEALLDENNITKNLISGRDGTSFEVYYFDWEGTVIWGATGRIVAQLLNLLFGKDL